VTQLQELPLNEAYGQYVIGLKDKQRQGISQNLNRFVQWCGRSRPITALTPQDVASYCEWLGLSGGDVAKKLEPVKAFLSYLKKKDMVNMSLAPHARVPKSKTRSRNSMNQQSAMEAPQLTKAGFQKLTTELAARKEERTKIVGDIGRAMADKDFRENAPLDAAKERQGLVESMIRDLEQTLNTAVIAGSSSAKKFQRVAIGKKVNLKDPGNGRKFSYLVVHPREANPGEGKLSSESPVGKALMNKRAGEEVQVKVPKGSIHYLIERVTS
jgi:transcription elongation factor GreA